MSPHQEKKMETVNLVQTGVKASAPSSSAVAVSPGDVVTNKQELVPTGNVLPNNVEAEASKQKIEDTVKELNSFVQNIQRGIQFSVHEETGRSIVTITDKDTGEEIRKFPSEEVLAIAAQISETLAVPDDRAVGLFVNGSA